MAGGSGGAEEQRTVASSLYLVYHHSGEVTESVALHWAKTGFRWIHPIPEDPNFIE